VRGLDWRLQFTTALDTYWAEVCQAFDQDEHIPAREMAERARAREFPDPKKAELAADDGLLTITQRTIDLRSILEEIQSSNELNLRWVQFEDCLVLSGNLGIHDSYSTEDLRLNFGLAFNRCLFLTPIYLFNVQLGSLSVSYCRFAANCRFRNCKAGTIDFGFSHFLKGLRFSSSISETVFRLTVCDISGGVNLTYARFESLQVSESWVWDGIDLSNSYFKRFYLNRCDCSGTISFVSARFEDVLDLRGLRPIGSSLETTFDVGDLRAQTRAGLEGDLIISDGQLFPARSLRGIGRIHGEQSTGDTSSVLRGLEKAKAQYSALYANFAASSEPAKWETADRCHSRYSRLRCREVLLRGYYFEWLGRIVTRIVLGDGIWIRYPLITAAIVINGCGLAYAGPLGSLVESSLANGTTMKLIDLPMLERLLTGIYFSSITFSTIGYGDWHPLGFARALAASEGLLGVVLVAAFTVVLTRRIIR
jgi:Ion channel